VSSRIDLDLDLRRKVWEPRSLVPERLSDNLTEIQMVSLIDTVLGALWWDAGKQEWDSEKVWTGDELDRIARACRDLKIAPREEPELERQLRVTGEWMHETKHVGNVWECNNEICRENTEALWRARSGL
jgi:hypothetical protein